MKKVHAWLQTLAMPLSAQVLAGDVKWMRDKWRELMAKMYGVDSMPMPSPDKRMDDVLAEMKGRIRDGPLLRKEAHGPKAAPASPPDAPQHGKQDAPETAAPEPSPEQPTEATGTPSSAAASTPEPGDGDGSSSLTPRSLRSQEGASPSGRSLTDKEGRRSRWVQRARQQKERSPSETRLGQKRGRPDDEPARQSGEAGAWDEAGSRPAAGQSGGSLPVQRVLEPELRQAAVPDNEQQQEGQPAEGGIADNVMPALVLDTQSKQGMTGRAVAEDSAGSAPATPPAREPSAQPFALQETPTERRLVRAGDEAAARTDGRHEEESLTASSGRPPGSRTATQLAADLDHVSAEPPEPVSRQGMAVDAVPEALAERRMSHYEASVSMLPGEAALGQASSKAVMRRDDVDVRGPADEHAASVAAGDVVAQPGMMGACIYYADNSLQCLQHKRTPPYCTPSERRIFFCCTGRAPAVPVSPPRDAVKLESGQNRAVKPPPPAPPPPNRGKAPAPPPPPPGKGPKPPPPPPSGRAAAAAAPPPMVARVGALLHDLLHGVQMGALLSSEH